MTTKSDPQKAEEQGQVAEADYVQPAASVHQYRAAVAEEYGQWVAVAPIDFDNARAYNVGDPVPVSNVAAYKYDERGLVAKAGTKAAEQASQG